MYAATGFVTLLLGGWMLQSPPPDQQTEEPALAAAPVPRLPLATPAAPTTPEEQPRKAQPSAAAQQRAGRNMIPLNPTEAAQPGTETATPGLSPPTQSSPGDENAGSQNMPGRFIGSGGVMPLPPTYRRPAPSGNVAPINALDQQRSELASATVPQKAFANVQPPPPAVSPYMNLFRSGTSNGTIDNYTTLVRPALQQQTVNQQFGNDIFGLQRYQRIQGAALQQIDRNPRVLQGVSTPQYYQNNGSPYNNGGYNNYNMGPYGQ
jgi:hypothetical protein